MLKLNARFYYFFLPISLSLGVIILSLLPLPKLPEVKFVATDKLGHFTAFLLLVMTYLWAFSKQKSSVLSKRKYVMYSFLICLIIGGGVELLQHFLPIKRFGDWYDFYFDIACIIIGIMIFNIALKRKYLSIFLFLFVANATFAQEGKSSLEFQTELDREFGDPIESPLDSIDRIQFEALDFFTIDDNYIVEANLVRQNSPVFFGLETTTARRPEYRIWGIANFT